MKNYLRNEMLINASKDKDGKIDRGLASIFAYCFSSADKGGSTFDDALQMQYQLDWAEDRQNKATTKKK